MKEAIKKYLDSITDVNFISCYSKESKNLDQCINYIMNMAKEKLKGSNGFISDETVYHWAREYYEEDNIKEDLLKDVSGGATSSAANQETKSEKVEKPKAAKKPKKEQVNENQCDLFGGLDFDFGVN